MLDGGGGGGVGGLWYSMDLPRIWAVVNAQETEPIWQQATGWKDTADLASLHAYNLKEYKDQLAQAWPPERSEASAAYMAELDKLIASVHETHETAAANYDAVVAMAWAVSDARTKLKPIYDEYVANQKKLSDYQEQVDGYNADTTAMPQPSPGPSPVASGRQEELTNQARTVMYGIGSEITTAAATLKTPTPYSAPRPSGVVDDPKGGGGSAGGGAMLVPPVIPPVTTAPSSTSTASTTPKHASNTFTPTPSTTTPGVGQGPILGGTPTAPTAPPVTLTPGLPTVPPGPTPPGSLPPGGLLGPTAPYVPGGLPGMSTAPGSFINGGTGVGKGLGSMAGRVGPRAMPPGGVIGESGTGVGRPVGTRPMSRVNPPGGVIGKQGSGATASARPGGSRTNPYTQSGRSGQRRNEEEALQHWDPDNPWETEEGVAPVVLPPAEPRRDDPGPAIGKGR